MEWVFEWPESITWPINFQTDEQVPLLQTLMIIIVFLQVCRYI